MNYLSVNDATMRLDGSVVRYHGIPVYARHWDGFKFTLSELGTQEATEVDVNKAYEDGSLNVKAVPLGYINVRQAPFVTRLSARKQKQGLTTENSRLLFYSKDSPEMYTTAKLDANMIRGQALRDLILGIFPSFEETLQRVKESEFSIDIPVNRRTVVFKDELGIMKIKHWNIPVGYLNDNATKIFIPKKYRLQGYALRREMGSYPLEFQTLED